MKNTVNIVLIAFISAVPAWWLGHVQIREEISHIAYTTTTVDGYLSFDKKNIGNTIEVSSNGKNIGNISSVTITIANISKKNLDNIEISLEIKKASDGTIPEMIGKATKWPESYTNDSVQEIKSQTPAVLVYSFKTMNSNSDFAAENSQITLLFAGPTAPQIVPKVSAKGVSMKLYNPNESQQVIVNILLFLYIIFIIVFPISLIRAGNKQKKRLATEFGVRLDAYYDSKINVSNLPTKDDFREQIILCNNERVQRPNPFKKFWQWLTNA